jgi:hypothetical protein
LRVVGLTPKTSLEITRLKAERESFYEIRLILAVNAFAVSMSNRDVK